MNIYISGRMTGLPNFNYPAFHAAEAELRKLGHNPINPARINFPADTSYDEMLMVDFEVIATMADAILLLPGWYMSMGAMQEHNLAVKLKLRVLHAQQLLEGVL
jgi:hypothetical protein